MRIKNFRCQKLKNNKILYNSQHIGYNIIAKVLTFAKKCYSYQRTAFFVLLQVLQL